MKLSDADWKVMQAVWDRRRASARDVHDALVTETDWAYTTVKTLLNRLVEKGALSVEMESNRSLYSPRVSRRQARRDAVASLLDRAFDGTFGSLFHHLVDAERLTENERRELRRLLDDETERADETGGSHTARPRAASNGRRRASKRRPRS